MRRVKLLSIFVLTGVLQLSGQTKDSKIGELLNMTSYQYDKDAGAAIIYDYGETNFLQNDFGFYTEFTRKYRIKFFNDANLEFSEINIPLYNNGNLSQEIVGFKAVAHNLNNGIIESTQIDKKDLLEETYNKNYTNYKVAVAGIKAGSVMDVEYSLESPFLFRIPDWQFQYFIPVLYSEYIARMIPFYTYSYILKGSTQLDELSTNVDPGMLNSIRNINFQKTIYKFVKSKIPAFYNDPFITSPNDYLISLKFQLSEINHLDGYKEKVISTWPQLNEDLIKDDQDFGTYLGNCKKPARKVLEETKFSYSNKQQYLEQLVEYVKNNYDWNGNHGYSADQKPIDFVRTKKGNVASINLFLTALLREAGFSADPVILSTRDNGKIYIKYPFLHYFNYTIVLTNVEGKNYLLDATDKQTDFDQIPQRCINDIGLIAKKKEENWVNLTSNNFSNDINTFYFQLNEKADSLKCIYSCKETGYYALKAKTDYKENPEKFIEEQINPFFDETLSSKIFELDSTKTFRYTASGMITPTKIEKYVSIKPFLNSVYTNNPFKMKERAYPVDFVYARKRSFSAQIVIPEGAKLAKQPETIAFDNNNFSLNYEVSLANNAILINAEYCLKKPVYDPSLYPGLKNFFDDMIKYLNQNIEIQL
jgi:hypothetical protein